MLFCSENIFVAFVFVELLLLLPVVVPCLVAVLFKFN